MLSLTENTRVNIAIIILVLLAVPSLIYLQKYEVNHYLKLATDYRKNSELNKALDSYREAYKIAPNNRDVVHGYVGGLMYFNRNDDAYNIIREYIASTPKDSYWEDLDIWVDKAMSELDTKRCVDASASAWHVLARTLEANENNKIAGAVMSKAMNEKDCISK